MMNRQQRRAADKQLNKKLTADQYEDIKSKAIEIRVKQEVDRFIANFVEVFVPAMREYKISEERAVKIIRDIQARADAKYKNGDKGSPREVTEK